MADDHYLVLARRWRPQTFDDLVGQEHITRTLQNAIRAGRISHAFLFIGSRGIGKTTSARILAKCLNCSSTDKPTPEPCGTCENCLSIAAGSNIDVIEIDGASNNSVEDVRQIRENVRMVPSGSRYKVYVIDEVHQLSIAAFNALLKTLEEPPPHAVFILATTEAHKIPATIISRCQRFDFRRVGMNDLIALLRKICDAESVTCSDEALHAIARAADGGVRDAESILDQLVSYCEKEITFQDVYDVLGLVEWQVLHSLCEGLRQQDVTVLLEIVEDVVASGKDLAEFTQEILRYFRNLLVLKSGAPEHLLALPETEVEEMAQSAQSFTLTELIRLVEQFAELSSGLESQLAQRTALEALLIRLARRTVDVSLDSVLEKLAMLREGAMVQDAPTSLPDRKTETPPPPEKKSPVARSAAKKAKAQDAKATRTDAPPPAAQSETVDSSELKAALEDPHIAQVVDVFKGRIVEIHEEPEHKTNP